MRSGINSGISLIKNENKKYLKNKIKLYGGKIIPNFHGDKMPKENFDCVCTSVIVIYSVCKMNKNYFPQVFLDKHKYKGKEKKISRHITDHIQISSDDGDPSKEDSEKKAYF